MGSAIDRPLRTAILAAADSALVRRAVTRYGMRWGARRFVAGESEEEFLPVVRALNERGFAVAATLLGESVRDSGEAREVTARYCRLLQTFAGRRLDANVALKLTHVGLDIDPELAYRNATRIAETARETGNTIRLDMEQSRYVDATLDICRRLRAGGGAVGFVLQSYLYRSRDDLTAMLPMEPNVRIVKGAYLEPPATAYPKKRDVDDNYLRLVELAFSSDGYTAIATHDPKIVERVERAARARGLPERGRFEFQLLYGISEPLARALVARGYRVRLAVPFGEFWFPYLMRRLAERPANLAFFVRGALARR